MDSGARDRYVAVGFFAARLVRSTSPYRAHDATQINAVLSLSFFRLRNIFSLSSSLRLVF